MKKIIYVFTFLLLTNFSFAASGSSSSYGNEANLYKEAKKFILKEYFFSKYSICLENLFSIFNLTFSGI